MTPSTETSGGTPSLDTFAKEWMAEFDNDPSLNNLTGDSMWETFKEDFATFPETEFIALNSKRKNNLKCLLYKRGVYINDHSKTPNDTIGAALYECAQRQKPHEWTEDDVLRYSTISEVPSSWTENMTRKLKLARNLYHSPSPSPSRAHSPVHVHHPTTVHPPVKAHFPTLTQPLTEPLAQPLDQTLARPLAQSMDQPLDQSLAPLTPLGSLLQEQQVDLAQQDTNRLSQSQSSLHGHSEGIAAPIKLYEEQEYNGHATHSFDLDPCYLTEPELSQPHRHIDQLSANRLLRLLTRASHEPDSAMLQRATTYCKFRQTHGVSAKHTWESTRSIWTGTYLRPPDAITHGQGANKAF